MARSGPITIEGKLSTDKLWVAVAGAVLLKRREVLFKAVGSREGLPVVVKVERDLEAAASCGLG
jgi:hypothetical protein